MFIWHQKVHKWDGESLLYFQINFVPIYRREEISQCLKSFLKEKNIYSYSVYEIYGLYDLFLRLWLPRDCAPTNFREALYEALRPFGCANLLPFYVEQNFHHWAWADGAATVPSSTDIRSLSPEVIRLIREGTPSKSVIKQLETKYLLRRYEQSKGIKFFIIITPPAMGESPTERRASHIYQVLRDIIISESDVAELSMYTGSGFAWVLLEGKIRQIRHYLSLNNLVQKIDDVGVSDFCIKTCTCIATGSRRPFSIEVEQLVLEASELNEKDSNSFIEREEDPRFEIKGSFKLNVNRHLRDKKRPIVRENRLALEGVIKAVAGFLNADGGTVLVPEQV